VDQDAYPSAADEQLAGFLLAVLIVIVLFGAGLWLFGAPPEQDCKYERHGKGAYTAYCVSR